MDKKKLLAPLACAAAFAVLAGMDLSLQGQVEELSWQLSDYRDEVQELQSQLDRSVSRQEAAVREALETEASLFSGAETALSYRDGELAVEVSVVPKLLRQGESAFAVLDTGESAPLTDGGNGRLTASIPCSLREEVAVTTVFTYEGETRREALDTLYAADSLYLDGELQLRGEEDQVAVSLRLESGDSGIEVDGATVEVREGTNDGTPGPLIQAIPARQAPDGTWEADLSGLELPEGNGWVCLWLSAQAEGGLELACYDYPAGDMDFTDGQLSGGSYGSFVLRPVFPDQPFSR
ncbi:hypothetical protein [uncultured Intestinimonas sp.]|uniref:hypothetical protein n=1 Tax=uncultured Intestinimonas sp. TaxID=1689265 RepID=UPI002633C4BB|nr:hypothetical protein [uncultured Intestinimonas sp.]